MRVPANLITKTSYTSGGEYAYALNYKIYQGYYYELNNKYFAGKEFNINAPELIKVANNSNINTLLTQASTYLYGKLSKTKLNNQKPTSFFYKYEGNVRYYLAKSNVNPLVIKEVNKETFEQFKNDPIYLSVFLSYNGGFNNKELDEAETKIPGIKTFVRTSYTNPPVEEDGSIG